jgi:hypothetical protein
MTRIRYSRRTGRAGALLFCIADLPQLRTTSGVGPQIVVFCHPIHPGWIMAAATTTAVAGGCNGRMSGTKLVLLAWRFCPLFFFLHPPTEQVSKQTFARIGRAFGDGRGGHILDVSNSTNDAAARTRISMTFSSEPFDGNPIHDSDARAVIVIVVGYLSVVEL